MVLVRRLHVKAFCFVSQQFGWLGKCRYLHQSIMFPKKCLQFSQNTSTLHRRRELKVQQETILSGQSVLLHCYAVRHLQYDTTIKSTSIKESHPTIVSDIESFNDNDITQGCSGTNLESFAEHGLGGFDLPHHLIQSILEYLHTTIGISWMPTIAIVTVILRILAVPAYIKMRQYNALMHNHFPKTIELQMKVAHATNPVEKKLKQLDYMNYLQKHNINPIKPMLYQLPTAVIFLSFFSALRGIAQAQIPSFVDGGVLWFTNLTIPDPYYLLPMFACLSVHLLIRYGAAVAEVGPAANIPFLRNILLWSPFALFPFMVFQPSCMYLFWITSNTFSYILMLMFLNPNVQRICRIPELVKHPDSVQDQFKQMSTSVRSMLKAKQEAKTRERALKKFKDHMDKMEKFSKEKNNQS